MDWVILVVSGAMEAVWAQALDRSAGFSQPVPTLIFLVALAASMFELNHAVHTIPLGTAYAVWVGIGAALTVAWSVLTGAEPFSWAKLLLITGLVACVIGLKLVGEVH